MAPALRIPVALDLNSLKDQTKQASDRVGETLKGIGRAFKEVNGEMLGIASSTASGVALGWAQSAAGMALKFALMGTTAVVAFKAIGAVIDQTREQLKAMVDVADKSSTSLNSAEFFQKFIAESQKLKVSAEDMEGALTHAFGATKDQSPIDLDKWETGEEKITDVEKALRVFNATVAKENDTKLEGLVLFRDAQSQDDKVVAVLTAMKELNAIGHDLESLDLGEKMFGSQFVDRIRQGKISAEGMLATLEKMKASNNDIFPEALVQRAKEIDDKLREAQGRLDREMKPSWNALASVLLTIKGYWSDIIDAIATVVRVFNQIETARLRDELAEIQKGLANNTASYGLPQLPSGRARALEREKQLIKEIDDLENKRPKITITNSRGAGDAPTEKNKDKRDRFDSAADSVEKRTESLKAETANIDLNTQAREKARVVAELETVAKQMNAAAGKGENIITAEQRDRINEVADAYGKAALAIEKARSPLATFARESANVDKALNQLAASSLDNLTNSIVDVVSGTKTAAEAFKSMANSIISDLLRIAIRKSITGPLASLLGLGSGFGGGSTAYSGFNVTGLPGNAAGTDNWRGGPTWVGENGPEILNLPKGSQVIPNNIATKGVSGGGGAQITYAPVYQMTGTGEELAQMRRIQDEDRANFPSVIAAHIANPNSVVSKSLSQNTQAARRR